MSTITIKKISITALDTDAVVNAANDGLWAGGGVCGAIFKAAGYEQLQEFCCFYHLKAPFFNIYFLL
jgi:O-acetyl-ADP-ribose deacetylase (regulator of RNase III)